MVNKTIQEICGKDAKKWQMWGRVQGRERVNASDLQDGGHITRTMATLFLDELCREGYITTLPGHHLLNGKSIIIYQPKESVNV